MRILDHAVSHLTQRLVRFWIKYCWGTKSRRLAFYISLPLGSYMDWVQRRYRARFMASRGDLSVATLVYRQHCIEQGLVDE
jgi:hypothetical protein